MIACPDITLVAIDGTADPTATAKSLIESELRFGFYDVVFLSSKPANALLNRSIPNLDKNGYNRFCLRKLWHHISTSHCLIVHADSGINNPDAWDDSWLQYDYIGAPWPIGHGGYDVRVGNSGFCLRSKRLLEMTAKTVTNDKVVWNGKQTDIVADDVVTCIMYRKQLEQAGLRFAPVEVAAKFAFELPTPEAKSLTDQFGYHGWHNKRS